MEAVSDYPPSDWRTAETDSPLCDLDIASLIPEAQKPIPYYVANLAAPEHLTLIVGESGLGKSFLSLALANAIATETPISGLATRPAKPLVLDAENSPTLIARRFVALGIEPTAFPVVSVSAGFDLSRDTDRLALRHKIADTGAEFIVLDSLKSLSMATDENSNDAVATLLKPLQQIAWDLGVAIVILHHRSSKPNSPTWRGADQLKASADILVTLHGSIRDMTVRTPKLRSGEEPEPYRLGFETGGDGIMRLAVKGTAADQRVAELLADAESIAEQGGITRSEIADRFGFASSRSESVSTVISAIVHEGWNEVQSGREKRFVPPIAK